MANYDAVLIVSFGGPEGRGDVIPFLENVLRGRNVPRERMLEVAEHYYHFDGVSPINAQTRDLAGALAKLLKERGPQLPVYIGNRNWHPLLPDTLARMKSDGVQNAVAFFTSAFSSYSGCRQYLENIEAARAQVGDGAPQVVKLGLFYHRPGFLEPVADHLRRALDQGAGEVLFTAHSIPAAMAETSEYVQQLTEACSIVARMAGAASWRLVYQSRSGPPSQPWLEPDVNDAIREAASRGVERVIVQPIGFLSDHLEVLWDLDHEAQGTARELGVTMVRAGTAGSDPRFIEMIRQLIVEAQTHGAPGCASGCCPAPRRPVTTSSNRP